ncbi:MAG: hypothetical protein ACPGII_04660 [Opitutales bacterium]
MTYSQIKSEIESLEKDLVRYRYDHDLHDFVPAEGHIRKMILANIADLKSRLPRANYNYQVSRYGWRSVERNA